MKTFIFALVVVAAGSLLAAVGWRQYTAVFLVDARCRLAESRGLCLGKALVDITEERGPEPALAILRDLIKRDATIANICHNWGHRVGFRAVEKLRDPVAALKIVTEDAMVCGGAYIHGVLTRSGADEELKGKFYSGLEKICGTYDFAADRRKRLHCVHGLGHGLMVMNDFDLPGAIADCERLSYDWDKIYCAGGVFMENVSSEHFGGSPPFLRTDDPFYPCTAVKKEYQSICFHFTVGDVLMRWNKASVGEAFDFCSRAENEWLKRGCYKGVSRLAYNRAMKVIAFGRMAVSDVAERALAACAQAPEEGRGICYSQVAAGLSEELGSLADHGAEVCRRIPEDEFKSDCFFMVGINAFRNYAVSKEPFEAACRRVAGEWFGSCVSGALREMTRN